MTVIKFNWDWRSWRIAFYKDPLSKPCCLEIGPILIYLRQEK